MLNHRLMEEKTRTFLCLEMPDEVVKEIARVQELVGGWKFNGKLTELENLHLTLKFLGELDTIELKRVEELLKEVQFSSFEAKLVDLGTFSIRSQPRIIWAKIGGKRVFDLQSAIDEQLKSLFEKESRFMSHMTLARVHYVMNAIGLKERLKSIKLKPLTWKVEHFYLKKSVLKNIGPVYSTLATFSSQGENIAKKGV